MQRSGLLWLKLQRMMWFLRKLPGMAGKGRTLPSSGTDPGQDLDLDLALDPERDPVPAIQGGLGNQLLQRLIIRRKRERVLSTSPRRVPLGSLIQTNPSLTNLLHQIGPDWFFKGWLIVRINFNFYYTIFNLRAILMLYLFGEAVQWCVDFCKTILRCPSLCLIPALIFSFIQVSLGEGRVSSLLSLWTAY